jgi:hypothetical protein
MRVVDRFSHLHGENLYRLNTANVALPPKNDGVEVISDFLPIRLIF